MILYCSSIDKFIDNVNNKRIIKTLNDSMKENLYHYTSESEKISWENSLEYISNLILNSKIPTNCTVALEYNLPITSSRIDLMIMGYDKFNKEKVLMFELKQWSKVSLVENSDVLLETFIGNSLRKVVHPAYQVLTYKDLLCDYNKYIQNNNVIVVPCVVMHNYSIDEIINSPVFSKITENVNMFYKEDFDKFIDFINDSFIKGDNGKIIEKIDNSEFSPSKKLQETIGDLILGKECFKLLDNQMVVYDQLLKNLGSNEKSVSIIEGDPGTGKSVLAINLLIEIIKNGKMAQYVSRNTAPRVVYSYALKGTINKNNIDNLTRCAS